MKPIYVVNEDFPPINRTRTEELGVAECIFEGAGAKIRTDANGACIFGQLETLESQVGGPVEGMCTLTGGPAFRYEDDQISLWLNRATMYRFLRGNLEAYEYFQLRGKFGIFYAIKNYDVSTGLPYNPTWGPSDSKTFMANCLSNRCKPTDIHAYVDAAPAGILLYRHLGMRLDEFERWDANPASLTDLLFERLRDYGRIG